MGRFGFGFGGNGRNAVGSMGVAPSPAIINPSPSWSGTAGSGFGGAYGAVPSDPARTTAKPACRLLTPPFQWFTDRQLVGVYAGANNGGSLLDNMGLKKVIVHYEGSTHDILRPSIQTITDANGVDRQYFGWWCWLQHNGTHGHARVYFEAVPKDGTMQRRVIGPYQYSPKPSLHDYSVVVAPSQPVVAGVSYQTLAAAFTYLRVNAAKNPLVTYTEAAIAVPLNGEGVVHQYLDGWCTITATQPVSFAKTTTSPTLRPGINGLRFKGTNITLDYADVWGGELYKEVTNTRDHWLDGCKLVNSNGRYDLYQAGTRNVLPWIVRGTPWFTECMFENLWNIASTASLVRGCEVFDCWGDAFNQSGAVIGNRVDDWDSLEYFSYLPSMTVEYTGVAATATLAIPGANGANKTVTAIYGGTTATFSILNTTAAFAAGTNYFVHNVVDWINTLPGWTATLLDDTRKAAALCKDGAGSFAGFSATNVKNTPLTVAAGFDIHADWWQMQNTAGVAVENSVIADNVTTGFVGQIFFWGGDAEMRDMIAVNNAFSCKDYAGNINNISQFSRGAKHVVIAHNTFAAQGWWLRMDGLFNPDGYSLYANNAVRSIQWIGTGTDADIVLKDNHLCAGSTLPALATGTTIGGDWTTLYAASEAGDFTPAGDLLTNLKTPVVRRDVDRALRGATAPVGALA